MAKINYPDNPSDGDRNGLMVYNATLGVWEWDVLPGDTTAADLLLPGQEYGYPINYLIVAGGGGAGNFGAQGGGGGGGAGGLISTFTTGSQLMFSETSFNVFIGAGGAFETQGSNSSAFGQIAIGGGAGTNTIDPTTNRDGGSGGGASNTGVDARTGGAAISGQGQPGGSVPADIATGDRGGGGGGGFFQPGQDGAYRIAGDGGDGFDANYYLPSSLGDGGWFAGGGGGGLAANGSASDVGIGGRGGGANGNFNSASGNDGDPNTGGGAGSGGSGGGSNSTGSGGSGVVIVRYPPEISLNIGTGLTASTITYGDYKITTFTAGADTITIS